MATYEIRDCWSVLHRLFHWMFAISIVFLVTTGFYINSPWTGTMLEGSASFPMATMRYIHYVAAYTFSGAVLIRLFLYFFGNPQEVVWDILPVTKRNINNLKMTLLNYGYINDEHDDRLGHNVLAGMSYLFTIIIAITMILSGFFLLFPEIPFWEGLGLTLFGSQQFARFLHHLMMWWFIVFVVIHLYFCIWNDYKRPEGLISSIFTGVKFVHKD
ncbi:MAG: Ni/Fe-hydrogenase, b-type cytochrome subunit [Deltaproteobacteria bacterium]|nr:MAG: Ni/Fe-hydrogenase, b-type cytochrome subunit [Deltaproteobacteria bacterium]